MTAPEQEQAHLRRASMRRSAAIGGLVGVVLFVAGSLSAGLPPAPDAKITSVVAHFTDDRNAVLVGTLLIFLAVPFLLWFVGHLRTTLADVEGAGGSLATATAASFVLLFAIVGLGLLPLTAVVWRGASAVPATQAQFAFDMSNLALYAVSATAAAATVLFPCVIIRRSRSLPQWLVWFGGVSIAVNAVELAGMLQQTGSNAAGFAYGVGPVVWALWIASLCLVLVGRRSAR